MYYKWDVFFKNNVSIIYKIAGDDYALYYKSILIILNNVDIVTSIWYDSYYIVHLQFFIDKCIDAILRF